MDKNSYKNDWENKIIIGDCLNSMIFMQKNEIGKNKVDVIMIDPPYNEDKSWGKYQDQWKGVGKDFAWAGEGHGAYLDYLYHRLYVAKDFLNEEGCIMLFIGDIEYPRLRLLMEKIFGEKNYLGTVVWNSSSNSQQSKKINRNHEYVIIFAKNIKKFIGLYSIISNEKDDLQQYANNLINLPYESRVEKYNFFLKQKVKKLKDENDKKYKDLERYKYLMPDTNVIFRDNSTNDPRGGCYCPLIHPLTKKDCKMPNKGFRFSKKYIDDLNKISKFYELQDGKFLKILENKNSTSTMGIIFGNDETKVPHAARIHRNELNKVVFKTTGYNFRTKDKKIGIPNGSGFNTVKPFELLSKLLLNYPKKNAVVMDFFSGSGTTAIAVEDANGKDNGNRAWIMLEKDEKTVNDIMMPRLNYFKIKNYNLFKYIYKL